MERGKWAILKSFNKNRNKKVQNKGPVEQREDGESVQSQRVEPLGFFGGGMDSSGLSLFGTETTFSP